MPMMNSSEKKSAQQYYYLYLAIIFVGCIVGIMVAKFFSSIPLDFSSELSEAKSLGIVSKTILDGYPKSRDILLYSSIMLVPVISSVCFWFVWAKDEKRRELLSMGFTPELPLPEKNQVWRWIFVSLGCIYVVISFDINNFYSPYFNDYMGAWPFLGEEGANLSWAQSILRGGVYGKDFQCLYGPMLIYPLSWFMKVFGTTVVVARVYAYVLNLMAYGIILVFLYKTLRTKTVFIFAATCYFLTFRSNDILLTANLTYLRVALGFVPIVLTYLYIEQGVKTKLVFAGAVLGQSILFSQEVGICAVLAVLIILVAMRRSEYEISGFCRDIGYLMAGGVVSVLPMLAYFASKGALLTFYNNLFAYPQLVRLGYGAVAFPDFRELYQNPLSNWKLFPYLVIFVYLASALYLIPMLVLKRRDNNTLLRLSLLVFGAILFRVALGRSDYTHISFVSQPAFLLIFLFLDDTMAGLKILFSRSALIVHLAVALFILSAMFLLPVNSSYDKMWNTLKLHFNTFPTIFTVYRSGAFVSQVPRAGIFFDDVTAKSISDIENFLTQHTHPGDYVYFFPNEAAYYFLFDRKNPTRYVLSYFAITRQQRLELISDIDKNRPEYVIYSRNTWRVDDIMERVQVKEVCDYIERMYSPIVDYGDIVVLKRQKL
jgi:hypothetical protein